MKIKKIYILFAIIALMVSAYPLWAKLRRPVAAVLQRIKGVKTVADRVSKFSRIVRTRLAPEFDCIGISYPPEEIILVGLKQEKLLEVWVSNRRDEYKHLKTYPVLGASGTHDPWQ